MSVQQTHFSSSMNGLSTSTSTPQFQSDDHIAALNSFLGMSPAAGAPQSQMTMVSDQDMAAFLVSAAYTNTPSVEVSAYDNSPMLLNSAGITPAQSIQSLHITDIGADAALAVAGLTSGSMIRPVPSNTSVIIESPLATSANEFGSELYSQQLTNFDSASLASILSAQPQAPFSASSTGFDISLTSAPNAGFLAATDGFDQLVRSSNGGLLGKRKLDEVDTLMPAPMGVPLSKRVSMPASFGANLGTFGDGSMPIPTGMGMQRIASYHPGAMKLPASHTPNMVDPSFALIPDKTPVTRIKTESAANPPTQYQRKVAHNAIERRYRNNINDRISDLRSSVPALQHIRPKKKPCTRDATESDYEDDDEETDSHVDGVEAATKLNKATILGKSTEYIYYLRRSNDLHKRESMYLQEIIRKLPDGESIIQQLLRKAKEDSEVATAALHMPESALQPRKKRNQA